MKIRVEVDRSKWLRGSPTESKLLERGNRCCLGFALAASGISDEKLQGKTSPEDLECETPLTRSYLDFGVVLGYADTVWTEDAMRINDRPGTDEWREDALLEHCKLPGSPYQFVFVGEGSP